MIDYNRYMYGRRELLQYGSVFGMGAFGIFMLFYDSLWLSLMLSVPAVVFCMKFYKKRLAEKRRWELTIQFKDAMESLISAMAAGYSLENAMAEAARDLGLMYETSSLILQEFYYMLHKMELKVPVETLMKDLGRRSGAEDIIMFSEILVTAKRTGGNLVQVMRRTGANIAEKIEMRREIQTLVAGKKMESSVMTAVPLLMIIYLRIFSPGFLDPLYHNLAGVCVMTGALAAYIVSFLWGQRIMKIQL